jgi:Cytochrome c3
MRGMPTTALLLALALNAGVAQEKGSQEPPCMECHRPRNTIIDPIQFAHSVHGNQQCEDCHSDGVNSFPHSAAAADMPDCVDCHSGPATPPIDFDKIAAAVKVSVHAQVVDPAFRCTNCHSPHTFVPASRLTDPMQAVAAANKSCLGCHAKGDTATAQRVAFTLLAGKHKLFPHWELHIERNACVACHTPRDQEGVHLILPKSGALRDCSSCHAKNSLLVTKLYRYLSPKERAEHGWVNVVLFNDSYMTGATRNKWLDWGFLGLACVVMLGVAAHGIGRVAVRDFIRRDV